MIVFDDILRMRQKELKHFLSGHLKELGYNPISKKGYLYAAGDVPVLLVAHLDILTLFAVAFELAGTSYKADEVADVQLAIGLPPAHYGSQYERFEKYFLDRNIIDFSLDDKP